MPKNSKRDHLGSLNVFTNRKGVPFDRNQKFSKKSRILPKKPSGGPTFGLASTFGSMKKIVV